VQRKGGRSPPESLVQPCASEGQTRALDYASCPLRLEAQ
jgi:hypothetical protein